MFQKGQLLEVEILDVADGQKCFGRLPDGLGVFVHGMVTVGDRVEASITKIKKNYLEAKLVCVLTPSSQRINPPCVHFGVCGGCKWQHVLYEEQLRFKRKMVEDALRHIGGFENVLVEEALPSLQIFGYRNKVDFSFGDRRYLVEDEMGLDEASLNKPLNFALGFHAPGRFDKVLDIDFCHIATPEMNGALAATKAFALKNKLSVYSTITHEGFLRNLVLRKGVATNEFMVNLVTSWHDADLMAQWLHELQRELGPSLTTVVNNITQRKNTVAVGEQEVVLYGPGIIHEKLGDHTFVISPNSFFQTNTRQAERLYQTTLAMADLQKTDVVFDLYCGTGTISLFMARQVKEVIGFEESAMAIKDAQANAALNRMENASFQQLDLKHLPDWVSQNTRQPPDVIVTDPPRAGMHPKAIQALLDLKSRRIVYVSCNPASLARDAKIMCDGGVYRLTAVKPVDLFPHTYHVESVACLEKN